jgi:hypothetical protein
VDEISHDTVRHISYRQTSRGYASPFGLCSLITLDKMCEIFGSVIVSLERGKLVNQVRFPYDMRAPDVSWVTLCAQPQTHDKDIIRTLRYTTTTHANPPWVITTCCCLSTCVDAVAAAECSSLAWEGAALEKLWLGGIRECNGNFIDIIHLLVLSTKELPGRIPRFG